MKILPLLLALFLIIFEAIPESLYDNRKKSFSGVIEFIYRAGVAIGLFMWVVGISFQPRGLNIYVILAGYLLLRFSIFDYIYNIIRGLSPFYLGDTKYYDKFWTWFFRITKFPKEHFFAFVKFILMIIGVVWLIRGTI
jgi:glucan phosphoethanolaminetransferase (alkaline phosphatase superfamily)